MVFPEQYREEKNLLFLLSLYHLFRRFLHSKKQCKNSIYYLMCLFICYVCTYRILANKFDISESVKCNHFKLV